jgi:hypothetical protein
VVTARKSYRNPSTLSDGRGNQLAEDFARYAYLPSDSAVLCAAIRERVNRTQAVNLKTAASLGVFLPGIFCLGRTAIMSSVSASVETQKGRRGRRPLHLVALGMAALNG